MGQKVGEADHTSQRRAILQTMGSQIGEQTVDDFALADPDALRVRLVDDLPAACGGGAVMLGGDGVRWLLLTPRARIREAPPWVDAATWTERGRAMNARGEPATCADFAEHYGTTVDEALAVFWAAAFEWLERTAPAWAD